MENNKARETKVDIVVVNWNSGKKTLNAISGYYGYKSSTLECKIIVVDNASSDNSVSDLAEQVDVLLLNKTNRGFAAACNRALSVCNGDLVLFLNPDTESEPCVLEALVAQLKNNDRIGVIGPQQVSVQGEVLKTCGRFPTVLNTLYELSGLSRVFPKIFPPTPIMEDWDHMNDRFVDHVMGSYYLIRRSLLSRVGLMDENFFVYYEDLDLSKRVKETGCLCLYSSEYRIIHETGSSGDSVIDSRLFYSFSSRRYYWKKHFGKGLASLLTVLMVMEFPLRVIKAIAVSGRADFRQVISAYRMFIRVIYKKDR